MGKRTKQDLKKAKRKAASRTRKQKINYTNFSIIQYEGKSFPYEIKIELGNIVKHAPTPDYWYSLSNGNEVFNKMCEILEVGCKNQESFDKYFPHYSVSYHVKDSRIIIKPYKLKRIFLADEEFYLFPDEVKLPLCTGHKVIFSRHAMERIAERYWGIELKPSVRSLHFPFMLRSFKNSEFEITCIKEKMYLHSFGYMDDDGNEKCRGHFPITYVKQYAIAKSFLYDDWLGSTVTN